MSLSISSASIYRPTSEISSSNILNYKRRSKLISYNEKTSYISHKTINKVDTLKNCYNTLFDLKNIISDYILIAQSENRKFTKGESCYLNQLVEKSKSEILSAYNIYNKESRNILSCLKDKRSENKIIKNINNITDVLYLLYNDLLILEP